MVPREKTAGGAVAAGHPLTARAAAEVLREGGNAFDAVIAALWMACIAEPVLASPGGGGFLMAQAAGRKAPRLFDFFVQTPKTKPDVSDVEFRAINADFGTTLQEFHIGAGAAATPGMVPGLYAVHESLGSLPMARLTEMAVEAARNGVEVTAFQARVFEIVSPILIDTETARAVYAPGGRLLCAGARLRNGELADALEAIGREGPRIATEGEIAAAMLEAGAGGALTARDLSGYEVALRDPLEVRHGEAHAFLNPPPSCGGALVMDMLRRAGKVSPRTAILAPAELARLMLACDAAWRASGRDIARFMKEKEAQAARGVASRGTTHVSVIDRAGNAASATVSNGEGNGHIVPGCGFMLNNMLGEEDINPDGFYAWRPDCRLASMMAPILLIADDGTVTALGSGGSNRIRTALFQLVMRLAAGERDLEAAILAPRLHGERGRVDFEDFLENEDEREALLQVAEDVRPWAERNLFFGGVHIARREARGGLAAGGDARRAGAAIII